MDALLSPPLIMAHHLPFVNRDLIHQPHILRLDMDHDFSDPKLNPPFPNPPEYTSSPSLNSDNDDDPNDPVFDDYLHPHHNPQPQQHHHHHHHQQQPQHQPQQQVSYDQTWASIATPRAWVDAPQKVQTSFHPDHRRHSFGAYSSPESAVDPAATHLYLADYLEDPSSATPNSAAMHSPATSYISPAPLPTIEYYPPNSPPYRFQPPQACDPRFVSPAPTAAAAAAGSPHRQDAGISFADVYTDPMHNIKPEPDLHPPPCDSDSGEDEKSESDDPTYVLSARSIRSRSSAFPAAAISTPRPTRTPAPEPVPNLTKKSRGRRVPTADALYDGSSPYIGSGKNARTYVCKVRDCGKCFARSEHLKRHVRSIHTNEKPHRCPHPGCNKEFSRHDNLCQHMRVHRNYSAPKDGFAAF